MKQIYSHISLIRAGLDIFQLGLQAASSILDKAWGATSQELLQDLNPIDREWIAQSITVAVKKYDMHCNLEVELRMPQILAEQDFVHRLRSGEAVAALETLSLMSRFNAIVEQGADDALKGEFQKRIAMKYFGMIQTHILYDYPSRIGSRRVRKTRVSFKRFNCPRH